MAQAVANSDVRWYGKDVLLKIQGATAEGLAAIGFAVEAQAKVNVERNDQIDTGFLLNSIYTVTPATSTFGNTQRGGRLASRARGGMVERRKFPERRALDDTVQVVVGAEYGLTLELKRSYLLKALNSVATEGNFADEATAAVKKAGG